MSVTHNIKTNINRTATHLNEGGQWLPSLLLRLILFWEFWESGIMKLKGENWFGSIQQSFPFPFDVIAVDVSWLMATWGEIVFSLLLLLGLFTRLAAMSLLVITAVATAAVHWPADWSSVAELWQGYAITDRGYGNYKLPLLYMLMLLPFVFSGAGKVSVDELLFKNIRTEGSHPMSHLISSGLVLITMGLPLWFLMPALGLIMLLIGVLLLFAEKVFKAQS